ncbi:MAG: DUF86 domain-containing protein [Candidatus Omnitrophica bacterium]|nr:DUF86 domain-containing protein [Candidatus Omnitrophota bacterium]
MTRRTIALYLSDIKKTIAKIEKYTKDLTEAKFAKDEKTQDAVIRNLEIIGEAVKSIPKEVKTKYSQIPWGKIISMRNKIIHEYFGVDLEILWQTVKHDIPELKKEIKKIKTKE